MFRLNQVTDLPCALFSHNRPNRCADAQIQSGCICRHSLPIAPRLIERLACPQVLLAPDRRTLFPFEGMHSRVHPSDVATRCTSRVLVTGLLERIVAYSPDYWRNLAITRERSGSGNRWGYDFKAGECWDSRSGNVRSNSLKKSICTRFDNITMIYLEKLGSYY